MSTPLKVYQVNLEGRHEGLVAAKTQAEAAALLGIRPHQLRTYGGETGNPAAIAQAMTSPRTPFRRRYENGAEWMPFKPTPLPPPQPRQKRRPWAEIEADRAAHRAAAVAARRERVRKAVERALGEMYPSFASHRIASGIVTDAALAAMDSDGGAA
jgi:hypothetical protein